MISFLSTTIFFMAIACIFRYFIQNLVHIPHLDLTHPNRSPTETRKPY